MSRTITALLSAAALATPATAGAAASLPGQHHARNVARAQCTSERRLLGVKAFRVKYGGTSAYVQCVRSHLPSDRAAATKCRVERKQIGGAAFRARYGGPVALNRCIKELTTP